MLVQISTDHNIDGHAALSAQITATVEVALKRHSDRITRVEVHLSDENGRLKLGPRDMRCAMIARLEHHEPLAVTYEDSTVNRAVDGATDKLARLIEHTIARMHDSAMHAGTVTAAPPA